jgi:hypothetical protein
MAETFWRSSEYITTWRQFHNAIRSKGLQLLRRLDEFPDSILVVGCQRSGTTMLTRLINQSDRLVNYWFGPDDELDAALILSDYVNYQSQGRHCFQTTFVNTYDDYLEHQGNHKIIWLLRNPFSVVYSILYNWSDYSLNRLFSICGVPLISGQEKWLYSLFREQGVSRLRKACWAYNGKTAQVLELKKHLDKSTLMVIDYDDLVKQKDIVLPELFRFINLEYHPNFADFIHTKSLDKMSKLSKHEIKTITTLCEPVYLEVRELLTGSKNTPQ